MMNRRLFTQSSKITVQQSPGKGRGVFTARKIRSGEVIEASPVLLVPRDQSDVLAATFLGNYMFQTDNHKHHVVGLGLTSMMNHGEEANAEFFVTVDSIVVKAKRAIPAGVEVTIDYGWRAQEWKNVGVDVAPRE